MFAADLKIVRGLLFCNCALLLLLPLAGLVEITATGAVTAIAVYYLFAAPGIVATFHRFHSHSTFGFKYKWIEVLFTLLGTLSGSGSALGWAAMHRGHHRHPDTPKDPHSPIHGVWRTLTVKYSYGEERWRDIRDLLKKPYIVFLHKWYFAVLLVYVACLSVGFGLAGVYYGFCLPSVLVILVSGATNYISHTPWLGYQTHADGGRSTNAWWSVIVNCGEGWHNNHHHNPGSFTTKEKWWEWDMAGSIISLVKT